MGSGSFGGHSTLACTSGIVCSNVFELGFSQFIFKGMHQGDAAFERLLNSGSTGRGKRNVTHLFIGTKMVVAFIAEQVTAQTQKCKNEEDRF
jgi:hypothetical protein